MGFRVIKRGRNNLRGDALPAIDLNQNAATGLSKRNGHIGQPNDGIEGR